MTNDLDDFLAQGGREPSKRRKCATCNDERLSGLVEEFLDRKATGTIALSFSGFYEDHIALHFALSYSAVRNHVVRCLHRELLTGRPR